MGVAWWECRRFDFSSASCANVGNLLTLKKFPFFILKEPFETLRKFKELSDPLSSQLGSFKQSQLKLFEHSSSFSS
jgi:hypothetical protein